MASEIEEVKNTWDKIVAMLTPSTIRGLMIVCGTLGWEFTEGKVQAYITVITLLIYGLYEIVRTDSSKRAIAYIEDKMKNIIPIILLLPLLLIATANAQDLCVEPQTATGTYSLEIDGGTPIPVTFVSYSDPDGDWHCFEDVLEFLEGGEHTFRVMAIDASGWEGPWSDSFLAVRPGQSSRWKIRK